MQQAGSELTEDAHQVSGLVRNATASTLGRLHVLHLIPRLLAFQAALKLDLVLSDAMRI